jgi:Spy/CpxP family protein refolding chaperone
MALSLRWGLAASVLGCLVLAAGIAQGQPGRGRGGQGGGGYGGGPPGGGVLGLLQDESVRRELAIADEQESKLRDIQESVSEEMQSEYQRFNFAELPKLSDDERRARFDEIGKKREEINAKAHKEVEQVLLPQQRERIKQLLVQQQLRYLGVQGALSSGKLAETLKVTAEQKEKLAEKARDAQLKLQEAIEKARQEAQSEVLSVLSPEQQAQLKEMMGPTFAFQSPGFGGSSPGRGGPGEGGRSGRGGRSNRDGGGRDGGGREGGEQQTRAPRSSNVE